MRPTKRLTSHSSPLPAKGNISVVSPHISRHTDNTYDSAGRLISTDISENGKSASVKRFYGQNGLLSKEKFGNGVDRTYRYDVHGWPTSNTIGLAPLTLPAIPAGTLSATYYNSLDGGLRGDRDPDDLVVRDRYRETLFYADGLYPRYSGCPSAKETSLGGRYDYRFDAHDRLTKADYTAPDSEDEDFSTEYTYDDLGNPLTLKRYGIIDYTSGGEATYGLLDDLTFSYPYGSSQLESVSSASEGTDFYGRVGFPLSGSQYTWNDAGLMASDSGFGITKISYNDFGLPVRINKQNRRSYTTYAYSADGQLLEEKNTTPGILTLPSTTQTSVYSAGRIFYDTDTHIILNKYISYFPGGYFDGNGGVHYIHRDYQGSVVMETDSTGHLEKHRGYYPYGEPWAEPTNKVTIDKVIQPQTYQSKERTAATGDYDFGPRRYISAAPFWRAPDPKAHDYPHISPYAFCAANPIRYADPTGENVVVLHKRLGPHMGMLIQDEDKKWRYYSINGTNKGSIGFGQPYNNVGEDGTWDSPQEFLDSDYNSKEAKDENTPVNHYGYEEGYEIETTPEQDKQMSNDFKEMAEKTEYNVATNNCATTVQTVMNRAGIKTHSPNAAIISVSPALFAVDVLKIIKNPLPLTAFYETILYNLNGSYLSKKK